VTCDLELEVGVSEELRVVAEGDAVLRRLDVLGVGGGTTVEITVVVGGGGGGL